MSLGPLMTDIAGTRVEPADREVLSHPLVGGVILFSRNYEDPEQLAALVRQIHDIRTPKLLIGVDHEGGRVQRFRQGFTELPAAATIGAAYDENSDRGLHLARECAWTMAAELRRVGVDFSFAPVLDVRNSRSRIIDDRAFHHDPHVVARLGHAYIDGMQQAGMAAVGKHFPGHGTVVADSHVELPVDDRTYYDISNQDLIPFRLLAERLGGMMPAHILFPQVDNVAAGYSRIWIQSILRDELGYQGIVFSDDLNMAGAADAGSPEDRANLALTAGCDVVLLCNDRPATERLLTHLVVDIEPVTQVRLIQMHGRRSDDFRDLAQMPRWKDAAAQIAQLGPERSLDLGDDMLT